MRDALRLELAGGRGLLRDPGCCRRVVHGGSLRRPQVLVWLRRFGGWEHLRTSPQLGGPKLDITHFRWERRITECLIELYSRDSAV